MRRFLFLFVLVPVAIVVIALSVANRAPVTFSLDPLGAVSSFSLTAPLFFFLFAALAAGVVIGGIATWIGQGRWRRAARAERANAARLRAEAEQLRASAASGTALTAPRRDAA
jgi:uncharacterized membrane protein YciS (DUF1049 family)